MSERTRRTKRNILPIQVYFWDRVRPPARRKADRERGDHLAITTFGRSYSRGMLGDAQGLKIVVMPSGDDGGWAGIGHGNLVICDFKRKAYEGPAVYLVDEHGRTEFMPLEQEPVERLRIVARVVDIYRRDMNYLYANPSRR